MRTRQHTRKRQGRSAVLHEFYETPSGNGEAWGGDVDTGFSPAFPGPRPVDMLQSQNHQHFGEPVGVIRNPIDYEVGGMPGATKFNGTMGVTDPQTVDAHNFQGQYAEIRRLPDWHDGPVAGGQDHNALLPILYAMQQTARYYPQEVVQADLIKAV
jgi:hypothetical protein